MSAKTFPQCLEPLNPMDGAVGLGLGCRLLRHDVSLDRLLTLVGAGWGILLALEGATGVSHAGGVFSRAAQCGWRSST